MSLFSTRNHDGASGKGEPVDTVPRKVTRGLARGADREGCDTRSEWFSAPTCRNGGGRHGFDPKKAGRN